MATEKELPTLPSNNNVAASNTPITVPLWINNKEVTSSTTFDVVSPQSTSTSTCWRASNASVEDATRAVEAAQAAFPAWAATKPDFKQAILLKAADLLEQRTLEYAEFMRTEMGNDVGASQHFVLPLAISMLRDIAGRVPKIFGTVNRVQQEGGSAMVWKEPYGVVGGFCPWNAPFVFGIRSIGHAIATGNTTVIKGSEITPRCFWALGKVFAEAGLPDGVVNIIYCKPADAPAVTEAIISHSAVRHLNFTGSTGIGRKIAQACAQHLKPCLLELGGKNCAIVCEDADLDKAALECAKGAFLNSGQICMSTDIIILLAPIAAKFLATMKATVETMSASQEVLKVSSQASQNRLSKLTADALAKGAKLVTDSPSPSPSNGAGFAPTIIGPVSSDMAFASEEAFGPLTGYAIVATEEEAVKLGNKSDYGLSASVFTTDLRKGFRLAKELQVGAVHINTMTVRDDPGLPFGGVKNSGWGRFNTDRGFEEFMVTKSVTWDD